MLAHTPNLKDADLIYYPNWLSKCESDRLLSIFKDELLWEQSRIHIYGREIKIPRLNAWYGDKGCTYTYSGKHFIPKPWHPRLAELRRALETLCDTRFNSVLANYYRDGQDSVSWHSDDEPELGAQPTIASISLGATRRFQMKHKKIAEERYTFDLVSGSLLLMRGTTQHCWKHQIPKTKQALARINLTFRQIKQPCL